MQGIIFKIWGKYGHFKRPDTNDNPCTFSFMHKVAAVGFVGAVAGIERETMRPLYPQLCEDLLYAIQILNDKVVKEPHAFTKRCTISSHFGESGRRYCEYLKDPSYEIAIALKNERSRDVFDVFCANIRAELAEYPVSLGTVNCSADFKPISDADVSDELDGKFETRSVFSAKHKILSPTDELDLFFEWVPTHASNNFYTKTGIVQVGCAQGSSIQLSGLHRIINKDKAVCFM